MTRRPSLDRLVVALAALTALAVMAGGCGLTIDDAPTVIGTDALPTDLVEVSTLDRLTDDLLTDSPIIYMVGQDNRLAEVRRNITRTPDGVMSSLLAGTFPHEQELGVKTAITRDTDYSTVAVPVGTLTAFVDLVQGSLRTTARGEKEIAYAQIVFSLTELDEVQGVVFLIDGMPVSVPTDLGATEPGDAVDRSHFDSLNPQPRIGFVNEDIEAAQPSPTPTPAPLGDGVEIPVWFLTPSRQYERVWRTLERTPEAILANLFLGPRQVELESGLWTAMPATARVDTIDIDENPDSPTSRTAFVDLAPGSLPGAANDQLFLALAQIVYSVTELREIDAVIVSVAGSRISVPTNQGLTEPGLPLTRADFEAIEVEVPTVSGDPVEPADEATTPGLTPSVTPTPSPTTVPAPAAGSGPGPTPDPGAPNPSPRPGPPSDDSGTPGSGP